MVDAGSVVVAGFLMIWLIGWTAGGVFAWHSCLARDVETAMSVVWAVITCAFVFNIFTLSGCSGATTWLMCWFMFSFTVYALVKIGPAAIQKTLVRTLLRMETWLWRLFESAKSIINGSQNCNKMQPDLVQVSVRLVNGEEVFFDHVFHVQDYVITIQDKVESLLKVEACQLLQEEDVLIESQRICDAGIKDGSIITAVIREKEDQMPDVTAPASGMQAPPAGVRAFLLVWLIGWTVGEVSALHALASSFLTCSSS